MWDEVGIMHTWEWPWWRMIWTGIWSGFEQDYPSCGDQPSEHWHSGILEDKRKQHGHQKYSFNRSLGSKAEHGKQGEQVVQRRLKAGGTGGAWRPSGGCTRQKRALSPLSVSHNSISLGLINKIIYCSNWLIYYTLYAFLVNRLFVLRLNWLQIQSRLHTCVQSMCACIFMCMLKSNLVLCIINNYLQKGFIPYTG